LIDNPLAFGKVVFNGPQYLVSAAHLNAPHGSDIVIGND
jgi:hypothetical protein